jgi:hypothetical protein
MEFGSRALAVLHRRTPEHLEILTLVTGPRDGLDVALIDEGRYQMGPVGQFVWSQREQADSPAVRSLGNVPWAAEVGGEVRGTSNGDKDRGQSLSTCYRSWKARGRPASRRTSSTVDVLALRHPLQWDILASDRMTNRRG